MRLSSRIGERERIVRQELRQVLIIEKELDFATERLLAQAVEEIIDRVWLGEDIRAVVFDVMERMNLSHEMSELCYQSLVRACSVGYGEDVPNPAGLRDAWAKDEATFEMRYKILTGVMATQAIGGVQAALGIGTGVKILENQLINTIPETLPAYMRTFIDKLYAVGVSRVEVEKIRRQVERLSKNHAPTDELKWAYRNILKEVETNNPERIAEAVKIAMQEKARYNARRIARTELARAYVEGEYTKYLPDNDVMGFKICLSSNHPVTDICDLYATADLFGMGSGIYPRDKMPRLPAHPHCRCSIVPVYVGEANAPKQGQIKKGINEYFDNAPAENRRKILGVHGAREYEETGIHYLYVPMEEPTTRVI